MKKKIIISTSAIFVILLTFLIGFFGGQMYEIKQQSKFELLLAHEIYKKYIEKNEMPGLVKSQEELLVSRSRIMKGILAKPFYMYRNVFFRRDLESDSEIRDIIAEIEKKNLYTRNRKIKNPEQIAP